MRLYTLVFTLSQRAFPLIVNHDAFQFAPDRRWENAALTDMPMDEKSDLGDDEDDDDMISSGW